MKSILGLITLTLIVCAHILLCLSDRTFAHSQQDEQSRQIILEEFTRARPSKTQATGSGRRPAAKGAVSKPRYRRKTPAPSVSVRPAAGTVEIGVTIWRLRPATGNDAGARVLVMENAQTTQWIPERLEADTPLRERDRVRIGIESPRAGYLYVIDREQYANGSFGDPYLIFPTLRTRGGDNQVQAGKLIDIPAQEDNPNYLTLVPGRSDQIAEVLTIIIAPTPLSLQITNQPLKLNPSEVARWESWTGGFERFELEGGAGMAWSDEEKEASAPSSTRLLTQEEPTPQTIYRVTGRSGIPVLVTVPLRYRR